MLDFISDFLIFVSKKLYVLKNHSFTQLYFVVQYETL